jgi:cytochrome c-type biogenesis protein CcmH
MRKLSCVLVLALLSGTPGAREAAPVAADPVLEREVVTIASELRCLVCQNQSIAESNAPLAVDLRNQVREQLQAGRTRDEIRAYMVERYGNFVLYRPPVNAATLLLWLGPLLLMAAGFLVLYRRIARRTVETRPLSEAERERAAKLLAESDAGR